MGPSGVLYYDVGEFFRRVKRGKVYDVPVALRQVDRVSRVGEIWNLEGKTTLLGTNLLDRYGEKE